MPGVSIIYNKSISNFMDYDFDYLLHEDNYYIKKLYRDPHLCLIYSGYQGYPFRSYENNEYLICIEGMIYNKSDQEVDTYLNNIFEKIKDNQSAHIKSFVNQADGEFIIYVIEKQTSNLIVFGDRWGRLKAYHYSDNDSFLLSRENSFILENLPEIKFNIFSIAEFMIFEYNLANKTFIKNVYKTQPSFYFNINYLNKTLSVFNQNLFELNFDTVNKPEPRAVTIKKCAKLFKESIQNRVDKLTENNYQLMADLSGGYDSRAIFFGLCSTNAPVDYFTEYLLFDNESDYAKKVANTYNKHVNIIKTDHNFNLKNMLDISYLTGGNVNVLIALSCYNNLSQRKDYINDSNKPVQFSGFGGEYIRHPFFIASGYKNIPDMLSDGIYIRGVGLKDTCKLLDIDIVSFKNSLSDYYASFTEDNLKDKIKHAYFDYYNNLVNMGEERSRILNWTQQALMSNDLLNYYLHNIPRKYIDTKYFIDFMKEIDPKSIEIPIYKSSINLTSSMSIKLNVLMTKFYNTFKYNRILKRILHVIKKIFGIKPGFLPVNDEIKNIITECYYSSTILPKIINQTMFDEILQTNNKNIKPILTIVLYFKEIEDKHRDKIFFN